MADKYALNEEQLQTALDDLDGWRIVDGKLHKQYKFRNFALAIGWMMSAAIEIDKLNHHPEWSNVYNRVTVNLVTHDVGNQISNLDVTLAARLDALAG